MRAFEATHGIRVVADPAALDAAGWTASKAEGVTVLRIAPDEVIAIGASAAEVPDADAIAFEEVGYVVGRDDLADLERRLEWPLPSEPGAVVQGAVAGVPVKLVLRDDDTVDIYTWAAYAHDLAAKLGWPT